MKREVKVVAALAGLVVAALIAAAVFYKAQQPASTAAAPGGAPQELIRGDSWALGPADAPVTLVEFLDPECESCAAFFPKVKEVLRDYDGKIRFVVRYMPLHKSSLMAVAATEAAGKQGKYWEMQSLLFLRAGEWGHRPVPEPAIFVGFARELGLDAAQFEAELASPAWSQKAMRDMADGRTVGVNGTPTFFINGAMLEVLDDANLRTALDGALAKAAKERS